jgi:beta-phosphoglucomutase
MNRDIHSIKKLNKTINSENTLFFDMDDTLIFTNVANFSAYRDAIKTITAIDISTFLDPSKDRVNRENLLFILPRLTQLELDKIVLLKEKLYPNYLPETKINKDVLEPLLNYCMSNDTVLVTNSSKSRALLTLKYHNLTSKFSHCFFKEKNKLDKYQNVFSSMAISPNNVIVFENEPIEINHAIRAGVSPENIHLI